MLFTEFNLKPGILKALAEMNYHEATDIQEKVINIALAGKNIVGQSQTGTGKTAAFLIPMLQKIDTNVKGLQALILAPTRELVNQINDEIYALTKYYRVNSACVFGGASLGGQKNQLLRGPSIVVATPGRLMDFMNQRVINISTVKFFVLDEVDRMLDMGFVRDIKKIRSQMRHIEQTYTFSATIDHEIKTIIKEHVPEYEFIKIGESVTVDKINHSYIEVSHENKLVNLVNLIKQHSKDKVLVFTQTKRNTKTICTVLLKAGFKIGMLNGDMNQNKRMHTLKSFKEKSLNVLVTTDVAARGLNMDNVGLVINFDVPKETENYIHRIGRTGRAGAFGKAIMLVSPEEQKLLADIEREHRTRIKKHEYAPIEDKGQYSGIRLTTSAENFGKVKMAKKPHFSAKKERFGKPREERKFGGQGGKPREEKKFGSSYGKPREERKFGGQGGTPREEKKFGSSYGKPREERRFGGQGGKPREEKRFGGTPPPKRGPKPGHKTYKKFRGIGK